MRTRITARKARRPDFASAIQRAEEPVAPANLTFTELCAAGAVPHGLGRPGAKTLFMEPGGSWENGYCESLDSKLRDELLNTELFSTLYEA